MYVPQNFRGVDRYPQYNTSAVPVNSDRYPNNIRQDEELQRLKGGNRQNPYNFTQVNSPFYRNINKKNNSGATAAPKKRKLFRYSLGGALTKPPTELVRASGGLGILWSSDRFFIDFLGTDLKMACKNKYEGKWDVHDKNQILFQAVETTSLLGLCCCAPNHPTEIRFYQNEEIVMTLRRKFVWPDCLPVCSACSQWKATLEDGQGNEIGTIIDKASLCNKSSLCGFRPEWEFIDPYNNLEARVTGPLCCVTGLCRDSFKIKRIDGGSFGTIERESGKRLAAAITCCCCPAVILEDNFQIETEQKPPVSVKAKLIALRVLEDWGFFRTDALCWLSCLPCADEDPCTWSLNLNLWLCDLFCGGCRWPCYVRFKLPVECNPTTGECQCCGLEDGCTDGCCGDCNCCEDGCTDGCCGDCDNCQDDCFIGCFSCEDCDFDQFIDGLCECLENG